MQDAASLGTMAAVAATFVGLAYWFYQDRAGARDLAERRRRLALLEEQEKERKKKDEDEVSDKPKLLCYFGSQTGTAEGFAKSIAETSKRYGFVGKVVDLEDFDPTDFEELVDNKGDKLITCFTLATYGEGDPSDNAIRFVNYLKDATNEERKPLENLRFAIFGLGNRQYEKFNAMGRLVNEKLEAFGAKRVYKYGEGDDDGTLQEDFNAWVEDLHVSLRKVQFGENAGDEVADALEKPVPKYESKWLASPPPDDSLVQSGGRFEESKRRPENGKLDLASRPYFKTEAFEVSSIRELRKNPGADGKGSTLHIELSLPPSIHSYGTAFNLSIMPENDPDIVTRTAHALGFSSDDLDKWISIRPVKAALSDLGPLLPSPCTLRVALGTGCALNAVPSKSLIETLALFATDMEHKQALQRLCAKDNKQALHAEVIEPRLSLCELLERFPSIRFEDPSHFLEICPRLPPRDYTISSSSKENPRVLSLTISIVREDLPGNREFKGVCTHSFTRRKKLLDEGKPCEPVYAFVKPSNFVLPPDTTVPVVFIGPGTGIAPMRALMQERRWLKDHAGARLGPALLLFGCRRKDEDLIYEDEFDQFKKCGAISNYHVALSREPGQNKVYVQDILKTQGDIVWDWVYNKQGHIYVCGGTLMGKDVLHTMQAVAMKNGKLSEAEAKEYISRLSSEGRFVQELWS